MSHSAGSVGRMLVPRKREPKDALPLQRFPQQREPRGCANYARPRLGVQARHAFTAAATCTVCSSVRVSPDGR